MSLIPDHFSVDRICTLPYIEAPLKVDVAHVNASIKALNSFLEKRPSNEASDCLDIYQRILEDLTIRCQMIKTETYRLILRLSRSCR